MTKKISTLAKRLVMSTLLVVFFIGGLSPFFAAVSDTFSEISGVQITYADDPSPAGATASATTEKSSSTVVKEAMEKGTVTKDLKKKISEFASLLVSVFTPVIAILVKLIESLMSDAYIMGDNGTGQDSIAQVLYELWLVFRDVMNYLFILILLFFAFMNVLAPLSEDDNYALKTVLPKMILAMVVINLTWFGARVVFDVVDVSARVVFGLPQAILSNGTSPYSEAFDPKKNSCTVGTDKHAQILGLCNAAYVKLNSQEKKIQAKNLTNGVSSLSEEVKKKQQLASVSCAKNSPSCKSDTQASKNLANIIQQNALKGAIDYGPITVYWTDFNYDSFNQQTIAPLFAFSIMQIQNLPRIAQTNISKLEHEGTGWSTLLINILVALFIMIILIVLFALMVINLFFRVIILWINIIFSPFYGLMVFKDQLKLDEGGAGDYIGLAAFLKHAFAPVIMGLPLVIGFIMITVGKQYSIVQEDGSFGLDTPMIDNVSNLHQLFYYVMAIAVLWVGGVKAIEATSSEFVNSNMIQPIAGAVEGAAKFVATSPMYINFIPVAGDVNGDGINGNDSLSLKNISQLMNGIGGARDTNERKEISGLINGGGMTIDDYKQENNIYRKNHDHDDFKTFAEKVSTAVKNGDKSEVEKLRKSDPYGGAIDNRNLAVSLAAITGHSSNAPNQSEIDTIVNTSSNGDTNTTNNESNETTNNNTPKTENITLGDISFNNNVLKMNSRLGAKDRREAIAKAMDETAAKYSNSADKQKALDTIARELQKKVSAGSSAQRDEIKNYIATILSLKKRNALARAMRENEWDTPFPSETPTS